MISNRDYPLSKIFKRNTIKISYSCTDNISQIIHNHNGKLIDWSNLRDKETCKSHSNCRVKEECPMDGNCNLENVIYWYNIFPKECHFKEKIYIDISSLKLKFRWYNHKLSFTNPLLKNQMVLSKCYWNLKDQGLTPQINWKIIKKFSLTNSLNGWCNFCLEEICILE